MAAESKTPEMFNGGILPYKIIPGDETELSGLKRVF
jgi:hypothetical protein